MRLARRRFIQAGPPGAPPRRAVSSTAARAAGAKLRNLDARASSFCRRSFPSSSPARCRRARAPRTAIGETIEAFDRALSGLEPAIQDEIGRCCGCCSIAPTRIAVAGVWPPWREASAERSRDSCAAGATAARAQALRLPRAHAAHPGRVVRQRRVVGRDRLSGPARGARG
jgi:hypothetical protein